MRLGSRKTNNISHADHQCERSSPILNLGAILILFILQVVDKESATIDGAHNMGFETDHRNMQRLQDEDYQKILEPINKWAEEAKEEVDG